MLLIVSNTQDVTVDYLVNRIGQSGPKFFRLNTDNFLNDARFDYKIGHPKLIVGNRDYCPEEFSNVWYRRPERLRGHQFEDNPEGKVALDEWAEALEAFFAHIPQPRWMNHPSANFAASHKLQQLTVATQLGFSVPRTLVTQDQNELLGFYDECDGKMIVKPMGGGYIERPMGNDSLIYTNQVKKDDLSDLSNLGHSPTFFQEFVQKVIDVRITIVDGELHPVELIGFGPDGSQRCDIRRNNMDDVIYRRIAVPRHVNEALHALMKHYGMRFGAIDMAVTKNGQWIFFEVNPNGQWAWLDLVGGQDIAGSFIRSFSE
jgi:hypothetical protein